MEAMGPFRVAGALATIAVLAVAVAACGRDPTASIQPSPTSPPISTPPPTAEAAMEETATVMEEEATAVMGEATAEPTVEAATDRPTPTKIPTEEPALPEALATPRSTFFVKSDTPEAIPTPKPQLEELEEDEPLFPFTVTGSNGREVVFEKAPERIVAYDTAAVEILFAMGEGHRIIGTHAFIAHPPEAQSVQALGDDTPHGAMGDEDTPRVWDRASSWGHPLVVGTGGEVDPAQEGEITIVSLEPDLVYVLFDTWISLDVLSLNNIEKEGLEGYKVLFFKNKSHDFTRVVDRMRLWGRIVGNPDAAEALVTDFETRVEAVRATMEQAGPGPRVFLDVGNRWTAGGNTLAGNVLKLLNLELVPGNVIGYRQIDADDIAEEDPEIIITNDPESIIDNPELSGVSAVSNNRVIELPDTKLRVAGPRLADEIEELASLVYPDLFP
jgi:iron complex transport system substrate-binding protein